MPHDSSSNAPSSAKTSTPAPATRHAEAAADKTAKSIGESAFLTQQAQDAKTAISRVVADIQHELAHSVDPKAWVQVHPWATVAAAAVAGFVAGAVAIPSKEQAALKRLAAIEKALMPQHREPEPNGDRVRKVESGQKSFLAGLAGQVLQAVQPVLMSAITAGVTAKSVEPQQPTGGTDPASHATGTPPSTAQPGSDPSI